MAPALFCIAEEAKEFARRAQRYDYELLGQMFWLVNSRNDCKEDDVKTPILGENEAFDTDFIGVSVEDCRRWLLEKQGQSRWLDAYFLAIADETSVRDGTISLHYWYGGNGFDFGRYGRLPREVDRWYEFRVELKWAEKVYIDLLHQAPDIVYPIYWGHEDDVIDENRVVDVEKINANWKQWCRDF